MASSSSSGGCGEFSSNNPWKVLRVPTSATQEQIRRSFLKLQLKHHPDKTKGSDELSKKLNLAYQTLKDADDKRRKELEEEYSYAGGEASNQHQPQPSNTIIDKTLSEEFRRLFQAHVIVGKETNFKDNFQSFYKSVFDKVHTHPKVEDVEYCDICEEHFIFNDEYHDESVFQPYVEFVMYGAPGGVHEYLEELFGEDIVRTTPISYTTGDWVSDHWSSENPKFLQWTEYFERLKAKESPTPPQANELGSDDVIEWLRQIPNMNFSSLADVSKSVLSNFAKFSASKDILPCDIMLPAFFHTFLKFKDWTNLALKFASLKEPRWALLFTRAGSILDDDNQDDTDNRFLHVGDSLVEFDSSYAHLCYLLGSYDLNFIGRRIASLASSNIPAKKLAAQYLMKTNDQAELLRLASAIPESERENRAILLLPLFFQTFSDGYFDDAIEILKLILPKQKLWNCIQSMIRDQPEILFGCEVVAMEVMKKVQEVGNLLQSPNAPLVLSLPEYMELLVMKPLRAVPGALHILATSSENPEGYSRAQAISDRLIPVVFEAALRYYQLPMMIPAASFPGAVNILKEYLKEKALLGRNPLTPQPGQVQPSALLILRGIYHYKTGNTSGMIQDFEGASANICGKRFIPTPIADFITSNPLIQERILEETALQFSELKEYIHNYTGKEDNFDFNSLMVKISPNLKSPYFQCHPSKIGVGDGPDLGALERDVIGREVDDSDPASALAEKGYDYVDLSIIANSVDWIISSLTMAASYFYQAMLATPDSSIPEKFAYHGLILKSMKELKHYSKAVSLSPSLLMYVRRVRLSFIFHGNLHFSQILRRRRGGPQEDPDLEESIPFINEAKVPNMTGHWQALINLKMICPISTWETHTIQDGDLVLVADRYLNNALIQKRVESGIYSPNVPEYLYRQTLFNEVWSRRVDLEDIEPALVSFRPEEDILEEDGENERLRKSEKNEMIRKGKDKFKKDLEDTPITEREAFKSTRAEAMESLADLHGFGVGQVEHMMGWHVIRRTSEEGFIDVNDRSLNFTGEETFCRFHGVKLNPYTKQYEFLLEPSVPGDPSKPALFTMSDIDEIFGNEIIAAGLSFNEPKFCEGLPDHEKLRLPAHPYNQVSFQGCRPSGEWSKEQICGTNFHMTLYHLDLLVKVLTSGVEVGSNFPHNFRGTFSGLLKNVGDEIRRALTPVGSRKRARLLRSLEIINFFWFHIGEIEHMVQEPSQENGWTTTFLYGDVKMTLKTAPMLRDNDGNIVDGESFMDMNSPEAEFAREFNKSFQEIENLFPIIKRAKELAKISVAFHALHLSKDHFEGVDPDFGNMFGMGAGAEEGEETRPYSRCRADGRGIKQCTCCDWVPSVYHEVRVTEEQMMRYRVDALTGMDKKMLTCQSHEDAKEDENEGPSGSNSGGSWKATPNLPQYNLLRKYRVYGGIIFNPNVILLILSFLPLGGILARVIDVIMRIRRIIAMYRLMKKLQRGGAPPPPSRLRPGDPGYVHPNSLKYMGKVYMYEITKNGRTVKWGITSNDPYIGKDGNLMVGRCQSQLNKLGEGYSGRVNPIPFKGTRAARHGESILTKFSRRNNIDGCKIERGNHPDNPTKHWYPGGKPKAAERRFLDMDPKQ